MNWKSELLQLLRGDEAVLAKVGEDAADVEILSEVGVVLTKDALVGSFGGGRELGLWGGWKRWWHGERVSGRVGGWVVGGWKGCVRE